MRKLLIAVAFVVVAVAAAIHWWPTHELVIERAAKSAAEQNLEPTDSALPMDPPIAAVREAEPPSPAAEPRADAPAPENVVDVHPRKIAATGETPGRVVLRDVDDVVIPAGSGTLHGWWKEGGSGSGTGAIAVVDGAFTVTIPKDRAFEPSRLDLDGRTVHVAAEIVAPDPNGELVIEARRVALLTLHVRDAATHAELPDVTVVRVRDFSLDNAAHPGAPREQDFVAKEQASPIALTIPTVDTDFDWTPDLRIGAPGHAWSALEADYARGGDVTVDLAPGGAIEVTLLGDLPQSESGGRRRFERSSDSPVVRVRQPLAQLIGEQEFDLDAAVAQAKEALAALSEEQRKEAFPGGVMPDDAALRELIAESRKEIATLAAQVEMSPLVAELAPASEGATRFDGLLPGRYFVTIEQGAHWDKPRLFGRTDVEVRAATTALAQLVVRVDARPATVPLSGRLRLSPEWGRDTVDLDFEPIDVPNGSSADEFEIVIHTRASAAGPEWHSFDAGARLPGRWLVKSYAFEFQQIVDTGPTGRADAEIVIGDPADVVVHLIDESTGAPIDVSNRRVLLWNCVRPEESTGGSLDDAVWKEADGAWHFRAPAGEVELELTGEADDRFEGFDERRVRLAPGPNEFRYSLRRLQALQVRFEVDGRPLARSGLMSAINMTTVKLRSATSGKRVGAARWSDSTIAFTLPEAGRWRLEFSPIPGYRPIDPVELDLPAHQVTVHRVALVRDGG